MLPDRVSNPGPLTYESGALPTALRGPAEKYGKPLYYLLLIRISVIIYKLAYLINKISYSSYMISNINEIFNILKKISYMIIKDIHLSNIRNRIKVYT